MELGKKSLLISRTTRNTQTLRIEYRILVLLSPHLLCVHLIVVVGFECSWDPESYAGSSVTTGRGTHAGQVKG
jgi:hypothetical protein